MTSKRNTMTVLFQAIRRTAVLAVVVALFWGNSLSAAVIDWTLAGSGTWSTGGNWTPAGPPIASSNVQFDNTASGTINTMDLGDFTIASYAMTDIVSTIAHETALGTSRLTVGDVTLGQSDGFNTVFYGNWTVSGSAGSELNVTDNLVIATGRGSTASLTMGSDVVLNIGTDASNRGILRVAYDTTASHSTVLGTLDPGTEMNAWLSELVLGQKINATVGESAIKRGILNLTGVTTGVLDISGDVFVGDGEGSEGQLTVPSTIDLKIGVDASTRGTLNIASGGGKEPGVSDTSFVTLNGGQLNAFLTELNVGTVSNIFRLFNGGESTDAIGTLDASTVSGGTLNVDGSVSIGLMNGTQPGTGLEIASATAVGTVLLPSTISASAVDLVMGSNNPLDGDPLRPGVGTGLLVLDGTTFDISGNVTLDGGAGTDEQSIIRTIISGESAGLSLSNTSLLTVDNAQLELIFNGPVPDLQAAPYWGLRWDGDHVTDLETLLSDGKLIIDDSAIPFTAGIFLLDGVTYVGLAPVPEPSSLLLLGLGMLGLARYGRRRSSRRGV